VSDTGRPAGARSYDSFELTTLTPHLGAEVRGLDLSQPLDRTRPDDRGGDGRLTVARDTFLTNTAARTWR
jgi:hypothetical protein